MSAPEHVHEVGGLLHDGPARALRVPPRGLLDVVVGTAVPADDGGGLDLVLQQAQARSDRRWVAQHGGTAAETELSQE